MKVVRIKIWIRDLYKMVEQMQTKGKHPHSLPDHTHGLYVNPDGKFLALKRKHKSVFLIMTAQQIEEENLLRENDEWERYRPAKPSRKFEGCDWMFMQDSWFPYIGVLERKANEKFEGEITTSTNGDFTTYMDKEREELEFVEKWDKSLILKDYIVQFIWRHPW